MEIIISTIVQIILSNLGKVGLGLAIFALAYIANMLFSMYYNIRIIGQSFSWLKIKESGIKVGTFILGTFCLTLSISCILPWAYQNGLPITKEYEEVISTISILTICLSSTIKYIIEAYSKMNNILESVKTTVTKKYIPPENLPLSKKIEEKEQNKSENKKE